MRIVHTARLKIWGYGSNAWMEKAEIFVRSVQPGIVCFRLNLYMGDCTPVCRMV